MLRADFAGQEEIEVDSAAGDLGWAAMLGRHLS
jgi:hypothetical protein